MQHTKPSPALLRRPNPPSRMTTRGSSRIPALKQASNPASTQRAKPCLPPNMGPTPAEVSPQSHTTSTPNIPHICSESSSSDACDSPSPSQLVTAGAVALLIPMATTAQCARNQGLSGTAVHVWNGQPPACVGRQEHASPPTPVPVSAFGVAVFETPVPVSAFRVTLFGSAVPVKAFGITMCGTLCLSAHSRHTI